MVSFNKDAVHSNFLEVIPTCWTPWMGHPLESEEEEEVKKSRRNKARLLLSPSDPELETMHEAGTVSGTEKALQPVQMTSH